MLCFVSRSNVFNAALSPMFYNFILINIEGKKTKIYHLHMKCVWPIVFSVCCHIAHVVTCLKLWLPTKESKKAEETGASPHSTPQTFW